MDNTQENKRINVLSSFWLKVIAMLTMTFDHLGVMISAYSLNYNLAYAFRIIGRFSLPLFCFLVVEGVLHTKNFGKYMLRLGIVGTLVLIAQIVLEYGVGFTVLQGNIFIDLIWGAIAVKCLMNKNNWIKLIAIVPILIGIASYIFFSLEEAFNPVAYYFPYYLRSQYSLYAIILIVGFYIAYLLARVYFRAMNLNYELYENSNYDRMVKNILCILMLTVVTVIHYVMNVYVMPNFSNDYIDFTFANFALQTYAIISGAFILLYSGNRGYNAKWFKYFSYAYYPLHILVIYGLFALILG